MRHLRSLSFALVALGVVAILAGAAGLGETWTLTGVLLVIAGVVKVVVVRLWRGLADAEEPRRAAGDDA